MSKNDSTPTSSLLTVRETADRLRCSSALVYSLCEKGKLAHVRLGLGRGTIRIRVADLDSFLGKATVDVGGLGKAPASGRGFKQLDADRLLKAWAKKP